MAHNEVIDFFMSHSWHDDVRCIPMPPADSPGLKAFHCDLSRVLNQRNLGSHDHWFHWTKIKVRFRRKRQTCRLRLVMTTWMMSVHERGVEERLVPVPVMVGHRHRASDVGNLLLSDLALTVTGRQARLVDGVNGAME